MLIKNLSYQNKIEDYLASKLLDWKKIDSLLLFIFDPNMSEKFISKKPNVALFLSNF